MEADAINLYIIYAMSFHIRPHLERARRLIDAGDQPSLVYAALELRLGIEVVCYEKLRMRLPHISPADIGDWRPKQILSALEDLVDPDLLQPIILEMAEKSLEDDPDNWVKVCERGPIDSKWLSATWYKLGNFLHATMPDDPSSSVQAYPEATLLKERLSIIIDKIELIASSADVYFSRQNTWFTCTCGAKVQRSSATLREGQIITCINPSCSKEYVVHIQDDGSHRFESNVVDLSCRKCQHVKFVAHRTLREMRPGHDYQFRCSACGALHLVRCRFDYGLAEDDGGR